MAGSGHRLEAGAKRFLLLAAVWLVLSDGRIDYLPLGLPACLLVTLLGERIWRTGGKRLLLWRALAYLPGFLWRSFRGGVDVAWRVMTPTLRISPAFVSYRSREEDETARVLAWDVLSLMPGTLTSRCEGRQATIHLLADEPRMRRAIREEEERVSGLFRTDDGRTT